MKRNNGRRGRKTVRMDSQAYLDYIYRGSPIHVITRKGEINDDVS